MKLMTRNKLTILIAIGISLLTTRGIMKLVGHQTIGNEAWVHEQFEEINYFTRMYDMVNHTFNGVIESYGINERNVNDIITMDEITHFVGYRYEQFLMLPTQDHKELQTFKIDDLKQRILVALASYDLTDVEKNDIVTVFVDVVNGNFSNSLYDSVQDPDTYKIRMRLINEFTMVKIPFALGISLMSAWGAFIYLNRKRMYKLYAYVSYITTFTGILLFVPFMYVHNVHYNRMAISIYGIRLQTLHEVFNALYKMLYQLGYQFILVGIIMIILGLFFKKENIV